MFGLTEKLGAWLSASIVEVSSVRCTDCGLSLESGAMTCSECDGEAVEVVEEQIPVYWDMD